MRKTGVRLFLIMLLVLIPHSRGGGLEASDLPGYPDAVPAFGYEVVDSFPHSTTAYTQGLIYRNGFLYESTGLYGGSSLRKEVLETGEVVKRRNLSSAYFGEGLTMYNDTLYQLTWLNHVAFAYVEHDEFEPVDTFTYSTPGWGLTNDDTSLIMSDGTDNLYYLDPCTYEEIRRVTVTANGGPVTSINEMELIRGRIYANILYSDLIAIIEPGTGEVQAWLDLTGILAGPPGPLNGIAFDDGTGRLFVTGKKWPALFEITTDALDYPPEIAGRSPSSPVWACTDTPIPFWVSVCDSDAGDSLRFAWTINGVADPAATDSSYEFAASVSGVDTVAARVSDGVLSTSVSWIVYVETAGTETDPGKGTAGAVVLGRNRPNPFRSSTSMSFTLPAATRTGRGVVLAVYDLFGRRLATLVDSDLPAGRHAAVWDGRDDAGRRVPPGVFFCVLKARGRTISRKIALVD